MKPIIAQHWMLDAWAVQNVTRLSSPKGVDNFCRELVKIMDMRSIGTFAFGVQPDGRVEEIQGKVENLSMTEVRPLDWGAGITEFVGVTDSGIVIHTLAEHRRLYLDVFSCKLLAPLILEQQTAEMFGLHQSWWGRNYKTRLIKRG